MLKRSIGVVLSLIIFGCQSGPKSAHEGNPAQFRTVASGPSSAVWNEYGGIRTADRMGEKYSPLEQITVSNVKKLKMRWVYNTGEGAIEGPKSLEVTPIYHNGKIYGCSIFNKIFALDGETGKEVWPPFNPDVRKSPKVWAYKCRGVALWSDTNAPGKLCSTRIISNTIDGRVFALDADTGVRCPDFMDRIDGRPIPGAPVGEVAAWVNVMSPHLPEKKAAYILKQEQHPFRDEFYMTSAPLIFGDLIIVGGGIADNGRVDATSGAVQAFDVRTGELKWVWDPAPERSKSPKQFLAYGTPNAWAPMSADTSRGLLIIPTGAAAPDYYGAHRNGKDQYANSLIALKVAENGRALNKPRIEWQFKTVIQDKWDYDVASQPVLTNIKSKGRTIPVVIQGTKMGFVYIIHRETGQPVFPTKGGLWTGKYADLLKGVSVNGVVDGERLITSQNDFVTTGSDGKAMFEQKGDGSHSAFQPFPPEEWQLHDTPTDKKKLMGTLAGISKACKAMTEKYDYEGIFTPPSLKGSIGFPGAVGGVDWGGVTVDAENEVLYLNEIRIATVAQMIKRDDYVKALDAELKKGSHAPKVFKEAFFDMEGTPYGLHRFPYMDPISRLPCSDPPYGVLKAVSLKDGSILWEEEQFGDFAQMSKHSVQATAAQKKADAASRAQSGEIGTGNPGLMKKMLGAVKGGLQRGIVKVHGRSAGVPNFGGSLATKGGVLFIAAAADSKFRMYDSQTGKLIHTIELDQFPGAGAGAATPMTYVTDKNEQVVVVASGGNKFIPGKQGDAIIAFSLGE